GSPGGRHDREARAPATPRAPGLRPEGWKVESSSPPQAHQRLPDHSREPALLLREPISAARAADHRAATRQGTCGAAALAFGIEGAAAERALLRDGHQ